MSLKPTFECANCGLKDHVGQFVTCPVCNPLDEEKPKCFFLNRSNAMCRLDGTDCQFIVKENFDDCAKLEPQ